ncbi:MAG: hypothetical protein HKP01_10575 [Gemmatimonadetes bacterium]|nr:hypothetical protein [Gemmatimonadota bacterium]
MSMLEEDRRVRDQLVAAGTLHDAYHPEMEEVHLSNADRLAAILDRVGWPDSRRFGIDGEDAAWTILMHSISRPALLRQGRELLADAVAQAASAPALLARLEDRIRTLEGRPQRYGTIFDWDGEEQLSPLEVEERDTVDERRASVGLPPLANDIARYRSEATAAGSRPPKDPESKARDLQIWLKRTGWR